MRRAKAYSTVKWRKYLDVNTNPRAKSFLESRGDDVLWQIASNIHQSATKKKSKELVLMIHPNAGAVIRIDESEYTEVLNLCLTWFESRENYSVCSKIQKFSENISKLKKSSKSKKRLSKII
jgi:superfamily II helicase